ncbi:hypothetical protein [Halomarina ordinaria]|uniref:DsrE family protein n=1 Tax=Halomarina ordinaria TaxID=3033939 RepID=A0ABD5UC73_9EURY|nr:hypothetical protein [Halomarina sp. PSRA2]
MAKHAFLLLSSPVTPGRFASPLTYARQFDEAGHQVAVSFDGAATYWFDGIEDHPEPAVVAYEDAEERGLIAGVCDHCATFNGVADAAEAGGVKSRGPNTPRTSRGSPTTDTRYTPFEVRTDAREGTVLPTTTRGGFGRVRPGRPRPTSSRGWGHADVGRPS